MKPDAGKSSASPRHIAAIGLPGRGGTVAERLEQADAALEAVNADVVLFPEAYLPGYEHASSDTGPAARAWMADRARRRGITLAMGYIDGDACVLGVTVPTGAHTVYQKRFLAPAEARYWRAGKTSVIADTPAGRLGLLVCADVLHLQSWAPFVGRVDAVLVAAAWPDYVGRLATIRAPLRPLLSPLFSASNPYRQDLLPRAARAVGATLAYAGATGPYQAAEGFSGGTCVYGPDGTMVAEGDRAVAPITQAEPGIPLGHPWRWSAFTALYRAAARTR